MIYASVEGARVLPQKDLEATCPSCDAPVLAKMGEIKAWHWAHVASTACDNEPETKWHIDWKLLARPECVEVPINGHRADILRPDGWAIECQHSPITREQIRERVAAYGKVIWIFDARDWHLHFEAKKRIAGALGPVEYFPFRWRWPHRTLAAITERGRGFKLVFDLGEEGLAEILTLHWHEGEYTDRGEPLWVQGAAKIHTDGERGPFIRRVLGEACPP